MYGGHIGLGGGGGGGSVTLKCHKKIFFTYFHEVSHHVQNEKSAFIFNFFHILTPIPGLKGLALHIPK